MSSKETSDVPIVILHLAKDVLIMNIFTSPVCSTVSSSDPIDSSAMQDFSTPITHSLLHVIKLVTTASFI